MFSENAVPSTIFDRVLNMPEICPYCLYKDQFVTEIWFKSPYRRFE